MTTRKSYSERGVKYFGNLLSRRWTMLVLFFILFFLCFSLPAIIGVNSINESFKSGNESLYDSLINKTENLLEGLGYTALFLASLSAVFAGCAVYSYMNNKRSGYFFHSLPLRREGLLSANLLCGFVCFLAAALLNFALTTVVFGNGYCAIPGYFATLATYFANSVLFFVAMYAITVLAGSVTSTLVTQFLLTGVTSLYVPLTYALVYMLPGSFAQNAVFLSDSMREIWIYGFFGMRIAYMNENPISAAEYIIVPLISILLFAVSFLIYKKRRVENCGLPMVFPRVGSVIKYVIIFPAAVGFGELLYIISSSIVWMFVGFALGMLLSSMLINTIIQKSARKMFLGWRTLLIYAAAFAVFVGGCYAVAKYVDDFAPNADNTAEISYESRTFTDDKFIFRDSGNIGTIGETLTALKEYESIKNNSLSSYLVQDVKYYYHDSVEFIITTKSGIRFSKRYQFDSQELLNEMFGKLFDSAEFKAQYLSRLESRSGRAEINLFSPIKDYAVTSESVTDAETGEVISTSDFYLNIECKAENIAELLIADFRDMTYNDFADMQVGEIYFYDGGSYFKVPILRGCKNTIEYIDSAIAEKNGSYKSVEEFLSILRGNIGRAEIVSESGETVKIKDEARISEIFDSLSSTEERYNGNDIFFNPISNKYNVYIVYDNAGSWERSVNSYFVEGRIPAFVDELFKY